MASPIAVPAGARTGADFMDRSEEVEEEMKLVRATLCNGATTTDFGRWVGDFGTVVEYAAIFHAVGGTEPAHWIDLETDTGKCYIAKLDWTVWPTGGDIACDLRDSFPDIDVDWDEFHTPLSSYVDWPRPWTYE